MIIRFGPRYVNLGSPVAGPDLDCELPSRFSDDHHSVNKLILPRRRKGVEKGMKQSLPQTDPARVNSPGTAFAPEELPLTVRQAATYLGVSLQTVYLWVERKQIPHLRVMGRNIRFLKSDLEPFRATFKQEMGNGKTE